VTLRTTAQPAVAQLELVLVNVGERLEIVPGQTVERATFALGMRVAEK